MLNMHIIILDIYCWSNTKINASNMYQRKSVEYEYDKRRGRKITNREGE